MMRFDHVFDETEYRLLQRLTNYANNSISLDDCTVEIDVDGNNVSGAIIGNEFKMYKINDTEYAHYHSLFSRTNIKAKVFADKSGKTHVKGRLIFCLPQKLCFIIPMILFIITVALPNFHVNMIVDSLFISLVFLGLALLSFVHTIMHAAFSGARFKKILLSRMEESNDKI